MSLAESNNTTTVFLSRADERASVLTHGAGFVLSLLVLVFFLFQTRELGIGLQVCCAVFCSAQAAVYLFSTLSHAVKEPRQRNRMRAWDQGTIYLLIIGTYTPFIWQGSGGVARVAMLILWWSLAALGFYLKVFAGQQVKTASVLACLALGWLPTLPLIHTTPSICFQWMLLGGVSFSVGVVPLKMSKHVKYSHAIWHLFVILGSACHCYAIYRLLEFAEMRLNEALGTSPSHGDAFGFVQDFFVL